jgi:hypothetical protein
MFADLFAGSRSRLEVIVTFLAILELLKHGQARVQQEGSFGTIWIYKGEHFGRPMGEVSDWSAEVQESLEVTAPVDMNEGMPEGGTFDDVVGDTEGEIDGESEPR